MKWTLKSARNDYLRNTPRCRNCEFVDDTGTFRCMVKDEFCVNLGYPADCKYFTVQEGLLEEENEVYPDSNEDFDGGYVDFDGDIAP